LGKNIVTIWSWGYGLMEFEKLVIWLDREKTKGRIFEESTLTFLTGMAYDLAELSE